MAHVYNNFNPNGPFNEEGRPLGMCNCGRWMDSNEPIQPCPNAISGEAADFQNQLAERVSKLTAEVEKFSHSMQLLGPTILEATFEDTNPYRNLAAVTVPGYTNSSGSNLVKVKCMISGVESTLPDSICALHILPPQTSSPRLLRMLKLQSEDLHSPRNGLLLAYGIEQAFQQLEVSFVRKPDPNSAKNVFVMKVWGAATKHCTTRPLFKTSKLLKVSDYDNAELKLNFELTVIEPVDYSSDSDTPFSSLRRSLDFLCQGGSAAKLPEYDDIQNAEDYAHIKEEINIIGDVGADEKIFFHDTSIDYSVNDDTSGGDNEKTGTSGSNSAGIEEESDEQLKKRLKVEPLE
eukprot:gene24840-33324_t